MRSIFEGALNNYESNVIEGYKVNIYGRRNDSTNGRRRL